MPTDIATLDIRVKTSSLDEAGKKLDTVTKGAGEAEKATDKLQGSFSNLHRVVLGAASALAGLKLSAYIQEAVLLAARYETLGVVMNTAGRNAGYNAQQMAEFERALRNQGIAMVEARQTLSMLAAAQMDLSKSGALARAAQDLAVVGGINSSEAFERLVRGIRSGEIEVLRTIGLNIQWEAAYKKVATQLGKNADSLTSHEKLIARQNAALEEASKFAGIYEASMSTAGKQLSSMTRYLNDFKTLIGELGLNTLAVAVFGVSGGFKQMNDELTRMRDAGELGAMSRSIGENIRAAASAAADAAVAFGLWYAAMRSAAILTAINTALTAATSNVAGLAGAMVQGTLVASQFGKAMLAAVGGPWVLGLSVAAFGIYKLATHQSEAERVARTHTSALKDVDKALAGAAGSAEAFAGALKDANAAQLELARIDLERKMEGIRRSTSALGADIENAFSFEGLRGAMNPESFDVENRDLAEKLGFTRVVEDLRAGKTTAIEAAAEFERLRRTMETNGTASGQFAKYIADAADKLRLLAGNDAELGNLQKALGAVENALKGIAQAAVGADLKVDDIITSAMKYVEKLPQVQRDKDIATYKSLKADLQAVVAAGGEQAEKARGLLKLVDAAHASNEASYAKKLTSGVDAANTKARNLADALRDINQIMAEITGDEKAARLAKWGDTFAQLEKKLGGNASGLARLSEADKAMRAAIEAGFDSPGDMRRKREEFGKEFDKAVLGDTGYAMQQVWERGKDARALGVPEADVARYEAEAIGKIMRESGEKNLDTQREFNKEMLELSGRTAEAKILDIEKQAAVFEKAGIDAVRIEQWKAEKILQVSTDWQSGAIRALRSYAEVAADMGKQVEDAMTRGFGNMEDALVDFVMTGKLSFREFANSIISDLARIAIRQAIIAPLAKGLGSVFSGFMSGGGDSTAVGTMNIDNGLSAWAKGGAFDGRHGLSQYSGSIVDRPTLFAFAKGAGIMGEAGPEAILPLERGSDGRYGLAANGAVGHTTVNILNYSGQPVKTVESQDARGGKSIDVVIGEKVAAQFNQHGSPADSALRKRYGAAPALVQR